MASPLPESTSRLRRVPCFHSRGLATAKPICAPPVTTGSTFQHICLLCRARRAPGLGLISGGDHGAENFVRWRDLLAGRAASCNGAREILYHQLILVTCSNVTSVPVPSMAFGVVS